MAAFDRPVCVRSDQDIVSIYKDSEHFGVSRRVFASPRVAKSNNLLVTARSSTVAICKHGHAGLRTGETIVWRIINGERLKLPVNPTRHCTQRMHSKTGKYYIITERSMRRVQVAFVLSAIVFDAGDTSNGRLSCDIDIGVAEPCYSS